MSENLYLDTLFVIIFCVLTKILHYCQSEAMLDAILDFRPLQCKQQMEPYFSQRLWHIPLKSSEFLLLTKKYTKLQMSIHYTGRANKGRPAMSEWVDS